ncbi:MAG: ADP-ribosylglycohydrolase family protein [Gemmatimonadota bacterium]|nr:MAG: ADP-ribosylglycohydrolase family protein [Gemmatimonadota bacterium]
MSELQLPNFKELVNNLKLYAQLKHENGAEDVRRHLEEAEEALQTALSHLRALPEDAELAVQEPDDLAAIHTLRPEGPRRIWPSLDEASYRDRLEGALLGRFAGCILGSSVELWPVSRMEAWAQETGGSFPPTDYWRAVPEPHQLRYNTIRRDAYTAGKMDGVPVDDDLAYTLLGLVILEEYGPGFTVDDIGKAWLRYLPFACTAEDVALTNLRMGVAAERAARTGGAAPMALACRMSEEPSIGERGEIDNPYYQWIGADIRSDPWGYAAPGWPERAAEMAYRDATVSHRRNGIYGAMYFSAAIAAAFAVDDPMEALHIALSEIPAGCRLAEAVNWALAEAPKIRDYRQAHDAVAERFPGMNPVHTLNNACLTIFGIAIGGKDFTRVISETVAMGLDNDCTAATAGSIVGAVVGKEGIPPHWTKSFNNKVHSYLIDRPVFEIDDVLERFVAQAEAVSASV